MSVSAPISTNQLSGTATFLSQNPLFASLSAPEIDELAAAAQRKAVAKYHFIYASGETSKWIYMLMSGSVKVASHSEMGREVIKTVVNPGGVFGELSLTGETHRDDCAAALKLESTYLMLPADKIQQLDRKSVV